MAQKQKGSDSYENFSASVKNGQYGCFYIFHGDERYLLEHSLADIRRRLCPEGLGGFNYKRFEGKRLTSDDLEDAINTFPVFAERTFIEIHDFDIFKGKNKLDSDLDSIDSSAPAKNVKNDDNSQKERLTKILTDLPDYVCIVIVYDTVQYKPDGRLKLDKEILKQAQVVEFTLQEQAKLINWISRHFSAAGKQVSKADAEYLAFITDGHMTSIQGEIAKVSAYSSGETVLRTDIDAVVTPVLNAVAYKLTDAIMERRQAEALRILDELFQMREPPQKIVFSISLKMRQLLAARICIDHNAGKKALIDLCGIRYEFQASNLMDCARKTPLNKCCDAVILCSEAAYDLNSTSEPEARLIELLTRLAAVI